MNRSVALRLAVCAQLLTGAVSAHAALQMDCRLIWNLPINYGETLDSVVFGVKVRDWKPEFINEILAKRDECHAIGNVPESVRRAERADGNPRIDSFHRSMLSRRDSLLKEESLRNQVRTTTSQANLTQVALDPGGMPKSIVISYGPSNRTEEVTCRTLNRGIGYATIESYRQASVFAGLCLQAKQTDAETVAALGRQAAAVPALYEAIGGFARQVEDAAKRPPVSEARIKELAAVRDRVLGQVKSFGLTPYGPALVESGKKLDAIQAALEGRVCIAALEKSNIPTAWQNYLILLEPNNPTPFLIVCSGMRKGAQVRHLSGGLFSSEGFEIKTANRTLQIFTKTQSMQAGDSNIQVLLPIAVKINDGKKVEVTSANLRVVGAEFATALQNY
jgi:hypothetical protein